MVKQPILDFYCYVNQRHNTLHSYLPGPTGKDINGDDNQPLQGLRNSVQIKFRLPDHKNDRNKDSAHVLTN